MRGQKCILIMSFVAICIMNFTGFGANTTVSVVLLTYDSGSFSCSGICDFSFFMCLDDITSPIRICSYNSTRTRVYVGKRIITFNRSAANTVVANIPEEKTRLGVVVSERLYIHETRRWNDRSWDSFDITLDTEPVSVPRQNLSLYGSVKRTRLDIELTRLICTPPFYLLDGSCKKFCQQLDNDFGHYTCTTNGDKICLKGWVDIRRNCTTRDPNLCRCMNGGTCNINGQCTCVVGFTGPDCSDEVDACIPGECNEEGTSSCDNLNGSSVCICEPGYTGDRCQTLTTDSPTTKPSVTEGQPVLSAVSGVNIGLLVGFVLLLILVIVLVVFIIRLRKSRIQKETESHDTTILQQYSPSAESNVAHSTLMNEHTYTNVNNNDNLQHGTYDEVLPANNMNPTHGTPTGVVPAFKADEIPGPGDSLYVEENVAYEPTVLGDAATNKEDPTALYEHAWK